MNASQGHGEAPQSAAPPPPDRPLPDFSDSEETFRHLSDSELREASWLFAMMGNGWLTRLLSGIGERAVRWNLPGASWGVRRTIYRQFVGGTSLDDAKPTIERLHGRDVTSILDYGAEAKSTEADFQRFEDEVKRAIAFCKRTPAAFSSVVKVTGIAPNEVLESRNDRELDVNDESDAELTSVLKRLDAICKAAADNDVLLFIDAEESWFQNTIDALADEMMQRYNRGRVVVLNTFQLYRHDRLAFLKASHERARANGYMLGTKLVRGAYMDKERIRAKERGHESPIQPDIASTHRDFDAALRYCLEHVDEISTTVGSHNEASTRMAAEWMDANGVARDHPHVRFAQLLGMSDNLTFNLASAGFNASKYVVYGPVKEVLPYLVRRAQENTSVTGEVGRELKLIKGERKRRKRAR